MSSVDLTNVLPATDTCVKGITLDGQIESARARSAAELERAEARIARIFKAAALLENAGFATDFDRWTTYSLELTVDRTALPAIRKLLGPMRAGNKQVKDARKRLIDVTLYFTDHPDVRAVYEKKLPRPRKGEAGVRCKIVKNVSVSHSLVCEIK